MKCPHCGKEVKIQMCLHVEELPGVDVEEGVTPVVGKIAPCEVSLLPPEDSKEEIERIRKWKDEQRKAYRERRKAGK